MIDINQTPSRNGFGPSRFGMSISGHRCVLGMTDAATAILRDRAFTTDGVVGLKVAYAGAFPGSHAWSPPI